MKPSQLTIDYIMNFLRVDQTDEAGTLSTKKEIEIMKAAAERYAEGYTGLPLTSDDGSMCLDDYEDVTIALLAIIGDMYELRMSSLDKQTYENRTVESILSMHSYNLI